MKTQINEIKRMQQLAGVINENEPKWEVPKGRKEVVLSNEILDFLQDRKLIDGLAAQKVHKELTAFIKNKLELDGEINENESNESNSNILDLINDYKGNAYALDQGYGFDNDEMEAEQENIKQQIIDLKGEQYFEMVDDLANLAVYLDEYAGPDESEETRMQIKTITDKMGLTPSDLKYLLIDFNNE